jgi:hypothetical protein
VVETKENPPKDQGDHQDKMKKKKKEKEEEKKDEKKAPTITIREKSAIKKTKVHKALKISTPADSEGASGPREDPGKEKGPVVKKDQAISAEGNDGGAPKDKSTPVKENAPNPEEKGDPQTNPDNNDHKVPSSLFLHFYYFFQTLNYLTQIPFVGFCRMNQRWILSKNKTNNPHLNHLFQLHLKDHHMNHWFDPQPRKVAKTTRVLETKKVMRSKRTKLKISSMILGLRRRAFILRIYT